MEIDGSGSMTIPDGNGQDVIRHVDAKQFTAEQEQRQLE